MNDLIPNFAEGTSAGKWSSNLEYEFLHTSLLGVQGFTTTTFPLQELILAENERVTGSGAVESYSPNSDDPTLVRELREVSGLTWDQMASLFGVSRRTLHFWDSGNAMAASNQEKLGRILGAIKSFDTGSASENRRLLLTTVEGVLPLDLLRDGRYDDFNNIKNYFSGRSPRPTVSVAESSARSPLPLEVLASAKQDRIHKEKRKVRSVKVRRSKKV